MTEEELDAAVDVIAAVDAGVLQSLNQRIQAKAKILNIGFELQADCGSL